MVQMLILRSPLDTAAMAAAALPDRKFEGDAGGVVVGGVDEGGEAVARKGGAGGSCCIGEFDDCGRKGERV